MTTHSGTLGGWALDALTTFWPFLVILVPLSLYIFFTSELGDELRLRLIGKWYVVPSSSERRWFK